MKRITHRKEQALQALLTSRTKAEAAKIAGIGESTLRSYLKDAEFVERYREAVNDRLEDATRLAQRLMSTALGVLANVMTNKEEQPQARISASRTLLEYGVKLTEQLDIVNRMAELERVVSELEERKM